MANITGNSKDYLAITKYIKQRNEMYTGEQTRTKKALLQADPSKQKCGRRISMNIMIMTMECLNCGMKNI